jgi:hypothetical protein
LHNETIVLPSGESANLKMTLPITPENGIIHMQRWGMSGARATSWARMNLQGGATVCYMEFIPREIVFDGFADGVYTEDRPLNGVIIGGLKVPGEYRSQGIASVFLAKIISILKNMTDFDLIFNFVLDERLSFFIERGWEAVEDDVDVRFVLKDKVDLPPEFTLIIHPLKSLEMPKKSVEILGLPA